MATERGQDRIEARDRNPERLLRVMASGRTPGRRSSADPAAVPLGTDEEASGAMLRREALDEEVRRAASGEGRLGLTAEEAADRADARIPVRESSGPSPRLVFGLVMVMAVVAGVLLWMGAA